MAMNKKEQAELAQARLDRDRALALRFRSEPLPEPMDRKGFSFINELRQGWSENVYTRSVSPGCFSSISHAIGKTHETRAQTQGTFYATRFEALLILRHKMTLEYANYLAKVDREIEQERINPTPIPDTSKGR